MPLYETAKYSVMKKETKRIELRQYPTFYVAKTTTKLDRRYSGGFNQVFGYISGENETREKISMTTPVITTTTDDSLTTGFVIPSKFSKNAPKPSNDRVTLSEIKEGIYIAIRFSGNWKKERFEKEDQKLKEFIDSKNYKIVSERFLLRYQPPFIPGFLKRNEVMYRIEVPATEEK